MLAVLHTGSFNFTAAYAKPSLGAISPVLSPFYSDVSPVSVKVTKGSDNHSDCELGERRAKISFQSSWVSLEQSRKLLESWS